MWIITIPEAPEYQLTSHCRWLKPGQRLSIGRHPTNDVVVEGAKSVSKQHAVIEVAPVVEGSCGNLEQRSTLTIIDLGSKFKTFLTFPDEREEALSGDAHQLSTVNVGLQLGKASKAVGAVFSISWHEIVLTLSNVKAKLVSQKCDFLDIKICKDYHERTTHVVTTKYNTPKTLQALALQKWIVGQAFITAMYDRADQLVMNMESMPDPALGDLLPSDAFSDEFGHAAFLPKVGREKTFANLSFVFFTATQYNSLSGPIRAGGGESSLYDNAEFTMVAISKYLYNREKPVMIPPVDDEVRTELLDRLAEAIGCMSMTQGDFIQVILSDGRHEVYSAGKTQLLEEIATSYVHGIEAATVIPEKTNENLPLPLAPLNNIDTRVAINQPVPLLLEKDDTKRTTKRIGSRAFKPLSTFDDDLFGNLPDMCPSQKNVIPASQGRRSNALRRAPSEAVDLFDSSFPLPSSQVQLPTTQTLEHVCAQIPDSPQRTRKRQWHESTVGSSSPESFKKPRLPPKKIHLDDQVEEEFEIAPAAAAFRETRSQRQPQNEPEVQSSRKRSATDSNNSPATSSRKRQKPLEITEDEIHATLQANKERAEQQTQTAVEEDRDIGHPENLKNLGSVEFFHVELRDEDEDFESTTRTSSDRWDPRWNGRKNFKRFRRPIKNGIAEERESRPSIMIRLVESKPSNRAMADMEWLETARTRDVELPRSHNRRRDDVNVEFNDSRIKSRDRTSQSQLASVSQRAESQRVDDSVDLATKPSSSTRNNTNRQARTSRAKHSLFMPDESDSEDDPLKFRL